MKRKIFRVMALVLSGVMLFVGIVILLYNVSSNENISTEEPVAVEEASVDSSEGISDEKPEKKMLVDTNNVVDKDALVYANVIGYVDFIVGSISDIKVDSYDDALLAL